MYKNEFISNRMMKYNMTSLKVNYTIPAVDADGFTNPSVLNRIKKQNRHQRRDQKRQDAETKAQQDVINARTARKEHKDSSIYLNDAQVPKGCESRYQALKTALSTHNLKIRLDSQLADMYIKDKLNIEYAVKQYNTSYPDDNISDRQKVLTVIVDKLVKTHILYQHTPYPLLKANVIDAGDGPYIEEILERTCLAMWTSQYAEYSQLKSKFICKTCECGKPLLNYRVTA